MTLPVLIRREFWEHRVLWIAPVAIAVLLVACALVVEVNSVHIGDNDAFWADASSRGAVLALAQWGITIPQYLVMAIVLTFYLSDCLYAERKDRSILFWKSMPVSDELVVISKLLTALVVVPLGVFVISAVTHLCFLVIVATRSALGFLPPVHNLWNILDWLKVEALLLYGVIVSILWYAPLAAYLVLVSAWAPRNVAVWSTLPPIFAVIAERLAFGTHYASDLIRYRTFGIWQALNLQNAAEPTVYHGTHQIISLPGVFDTLHPAPAFLNIDLWLGVGVAAGFAFAAARIRRYRDDT
jgi:ABC-2 type transport system permease protein